MENFIIRHEMGLYLKAVIHHNQTIYTLSKQEWVFSAYDYVDFNQGSSSNKFTFQYNPNEFTALSTTKPPTVLIDLFDDNEQEATRVHEMTTELFKLVGIYGNDTQYNRWFADVYNQFIHDVCFHILYLKFERKMYFDKLMFSYHKFLNRISRFIPDKLTELDRVTITRNVGYIITMGCVERSWFLCDEALWFVITDGGFTHFSPDVIKRIISYKSFNDQSLLKLMKIKASNALFSIYFKCLSVGVDVSDHLEDNEKTYDMHALIVLAFKKGYTSREDLLLLLHRSVRNNTKKIMALKRAISNGIDLHTLPKNASGKKLTREITAQKKVTSVI